MPDLRYLTRRINDSTPAHRDRAIDALRALAITGVVLGHWLVTAVTTTDSGTLTDTSPLTRMPQLAPLSWIFQTLAVFFLVGGYAAAGSWERAQAKGTGYRAWAATRIRRLTRPVAVLLALWALATVGLLAGGVPAQTLRTLLTLVLSPLWFLLVYIALTAATPLIARLNPLWPLAVVLHVDLIRFGFGGPSWIGWINVAAGWMVPYCLGSAWARGALTRRRTPLALVLGGGTATAALLLWAGYPTSMVGVPGAPVSNLSPPTLAAVTFGITQCGLALLLREPLRSAMRRPALWAGVALANLSALTIFLWHQTAMLITTSLGTTAGTLPGLSTPPDSIIWTAQRILWIPAFAVALAACAVAFRVFERGGPQPTPAGNRRHTGSQALPPRAVPELQGAEHG
ncbi:acyltransferase family protein [Streptomyces sp. IBSNAI002]|uniref:acyltransferase family protein n=1 Tax=Streptomyces sp. IBSNAI002 TaxID=3457500 RepID=UPI003FCFB76A